MPVFYGLKSIPEIGDIVIAIDVDAFCCMRFNCGQSLQLELGNEVHVKPYDVVVGYNITDSLLTEGCIQIVLLRGILKFYITVHCQISDSFIQTISNREIKHKREVGLNKLV